MSFTLITASNIADAAGNKLAAGSITFIATDGFDKPIPFGIGGGGQAIMRPVSFTVTDGAIAAGAQVPDTANTSPAGIYYRIVVTDSSTGKVVLTYALAQPTGTSWNFDNYRPSARNVAPPPTPQSVTGPLNVTGDVSATGAVSGTGGNITPQRMAQVRIATLFPGADLGAQINAAIADLPSTDGIVLLPAGTYAITTQIVIGRNNVTLSGGGAQGTTLVSGITGMPADHLVYIHNADDVLLENLNLVGASNTGHLVAAIADSGRGSDGRVTIRNCRLAGATGSGKDYAGASIVASGLYVHNYATAIRVLDCNIVGNGRGVTIDNDGSPDTFVNASSVLRCTVVSNAGDGIVFLGGQSHAWDISSNDIEQNGGWGINFYGILGAGISSNYIEANVAGGINFGARSSAVEIAGNFFNSTVAQGPHINVSSTVALDSSRVTANFHEVTGSGTLAAVIKLLATATEIGLATVSAQSGATVTTFLSVSAGSLVDVFGLATDATMTGTVQALIDHPELTRRLGYKHWALSATGLTRIAEDDGAGSYHYAQVRPNAGKPGWLSFTEDAVADRWIVGIKAGDANLHFAAGGPTSSPSGDALTLDAAGNLAAAGAVSSAGRSIVPLAGSTGTLGGSSMTTGQRVTTTVTVTGANTGMAVAVSPDADPGAGFVWHAWVSAANTVTVALTCIAAGTPTATTYNVRVIQ